MKKCYLSPILFSLLISCHNQQIEPRKTNIQDNPDSIQQSKIDSANITTDTVRTVKFQDTVMTVIEVKPGPDYGEEQTIYLYPSMLKDTVEINLGYMKAMSMNLYDLQDTTIKVIPYALTDKYMLIPKVVSDTRTGVIILQFDQDSINDSYYTMGLKAPIIIKENDNYNILVARHEWTDDERGFIDYLDLRKISPSQNRDEAAIFKYLHDGQTNNPNLYKKIKDFDYWFDPTQKDRTIAIYLNQLMKHDSIKAQPLFK
jgi:hypothetical protein